MMEQRGHGDSSISSFDLGGRTAEEVRCTNCSGIYCGRRNIRVVDGRPLCVCNLKLIGGAPGTGAERQPPC